jgi:hypothetical protein
MFDNPGPHVIEATDPVQDISIRLWKQDGMWEWDIRWPGPPQMRSTGAARTLREALVDVTSDVLVLA